MAAVTVNSIKHNVSGSVREQIYDITGGNGDTLDVGLANVSSVTIEPTANGPTSMTRTANTPYAGQTRLTFTSGGAYTNAKLVVKGT